LFVLTALMCVASRSTALQSHLAAGTTGTDAPGKEVVALVVDDHDLGMEAAVALASIAVLPPSAWNRST
jgi:hypothetical protein